MPPKTPSPVIEALWESVDGNWHDESVHDAFVSACAEENDLAFAARKYRQQKDGDEAERHATSEAQLQRITGMALAQMSALRTPPEKNRHAVTILAAIVSGGLILACIYLLTL